MVDIFAKYAFWIIICLPVAVIGIVFIVRLAKINKTINKELDEIQKKKDQADFERQLFEISYKRKYQDGR